MANARLLILLALLACLMAATFARADDDDFDSEANGAVEDEEEPEEDLINDHKDQNTQFTDARVSFADYSLSELNTLKLPAGEKVSTFVSFQNKIGGSPSQLFIVAAHLNQVGNPEAYVQNFSAVRSMRTVNAGETATVQYEFRPDAMLEPMDYNLVIRVFFLNEENTTFVAVAYNSTVSISDPLGTDFKAITTYFILAALIGGAVYLFSGNNNSVITAGKKASPASTISALAAAAKKDGADNITDNKTYNADYVSAEHLKFREQLLKQNAARAGSPKSNKKK